MTVPYDAIVSQLTTMGWSKEKAEEAARQVHPEVAIARDRNALRQAELLEKDLVAHADKQLRALGFRVISQSQPRHAKYLTPGIPDRLYFHRARGVAVYWEAKTATGEQSPSQKDFQDDCEACGWNYVLGTPDALYAWLIDHGIAAEEGALLVPLPYTPLLRSA